MSAQIYFLMSSSIFCMFYVVQVMWLGMYSYVRVYYADNLSQSVNPVGVHLLYRF